MDFVVRDVGGLLFCMVSRDRRKACRMPLSFPWAKHLIPVLRNPLFSFPLVTPTTQLVREPYK